MSLDLGRYQKLLRAATDYTYQATVVNTETTEVHHTSGCEIVTGYTVENYKENPQLWYDMIHPADRDRVLSEISRLLAGQIISPFEHRIIHKDGSVRWIRNVVVPEYDLAGQLVGYDGLINDITRLKQMELALRSSEVKFRALTEATAAAIFICYQATIVYANAAAAAITGYLPDELTQLHFTDLIHPTDAPQVQQILLEFKSGPAPAMRQELQWLDREGQIHWMNATFGSIEFKEQAAIIITAFDITTHRQVQTESLKLLEAERQQRLVAETLGDAFLTLTAQTNRHELLEEILKQVRRLIPYDAANVMLIQQNKLQVTHWNGYEAFGSTEYFNRLNQSLDAFPLDAQAVHSRQPVVVPDTRREKSWVVVPETAWIRSFIGVPLCLRQQVLGVLRLDHTRPNAFSQTDLERVQPLAHAAAIALEKTQLIEHARQELAERTKIEKELRRIAAQRQAVLNAIPDSLLYFDQAGTLVDYKLTTHTGKLNTLLVRLDAVQPNLGNDPLVEQFQTFVKQALQQESVGVFEFDLGDKPPTKHFEARFVKATPNEVLCIVRNISARKQAEQNLIRSERLAALGQLTATMAHEINNPLQAIQVNLDLVLDFPIDEQDMHASLETVRREIRRLHDLSRRVLTYARPGISSRTPVDMVEIIEQVLKLSRRQLEKHKIEVVTSLQQVPKVLASSGQLLQVTLNMVINAIEAVSGRQGKLKISVYADGVWVCTDFENNGPPIPNEHLAYLFEPFFTTKSEGSGLGLWVSHVIIQQHNGSLSVENLAARQGVVFSIRLPALP